MQELRVIIAGSRDFTNYETLCACCDSLLSDKDNVHIISGCARGADKLGCRYAEERKYKLTRMPAHWEDYGKAAGYIRNTEMARYAIEGCNKGMLIAFWDGQSKGTKHMIDTATKYGMEVRYFQIDEVQ